MRYQKLDQILLEMGLVDENILGKAKEIQQESGGQLDEILIRMKQITEGQALTVRQKQLGLSIWDLSDVDPEPELSALIPERLAKRLGAVPVRKKDGILYVAMKNPADFMTNSAISFTANLSQNLCRIVFSIFILYHLYSFCTAYHFSLMHFYFLLLKKIYICIVYPFILTFLMSSNININTILLDRTTTVFRYIDLTVDYYL